MKDFAFISDFDGTLTKKDFYKILSDTYLKEKFPPLFKAWKNGEMKDREYLSYVFNNVKRNNILYIKTNSKFMETLTIKSLIYHFL